VLESLRRTGVLLTEAMHGAIVADALRIPWIAVRTRSAIKTFKWEDWCRSMDLEYQPRMLPPVWPKVESAGALRSARGWARRRLAAALLARTARRARPTLSAPGTLAARLDALEGRLDVLRRDEALSNSRFHAASG
jgi:succinoglycan biosynthesis protein ExoV